MINRYTCYFCDDVVRRGLSHEFGVVRLYRTFSDSKVCRGLSHEFGVVRLYRTFSIYIVAGETRCAWCLCPSSGWFKHIEPLHYRDSKVFRVVQLYRTFSNYIVTGETRCTGCFGVVQAHRTSSNLLEPHHCIDSKMWRVLSHEFRVVRLYQTFSNYIVKGETKCTGCTCGWGWLMSSECVHSSSPKKVSG